jgi:pyruvate formate lyase activating enzyme
VKLCGARLRPVLDTLVYLKHETAVWFEITTLLIPGKNDSPEELEAMSKWIVRELGPDVPLHFTAFHPDYKMTDLERTPAATLTRAREIARAAGIRYVYTGNVHDRTGGTTFCPGCAQPVVVRDWHDIVSYELSPEGNCAHCDTRIPGHFAAFDRAWGRRRIPVQIHVGA